jgi:hypothetical protein
MHEFRRRPLREDLFKLVVSMQLVTTEDGGRKTPIASDYRPNCWFGEDRDGRRLYHDVFFYFLEGGDAVEDRGTLWVAPGGWARADAFPLYASYVRPIVTRGMEFEVCEAARVVARATVEDIIDPGPEYDIA